MLNTSTLRLRANIYWCQSSGRAVFLDAAADRYFCLSATVNEAFLRLAAQKQQSADLEAIRGLVARGLLIQTEEHSCVQSPVSIETPESDFLQAPRSYASLPQMLQAFASELRAGWLLRNRPFQQVIEEASKRCCTLRPISRSLDLLLHAIITGSNAIGFITRSQDRCLVRALAVHLACRKKNIRSKLVFGVIGHPFAAHCWVQLGSSVLVGEFELARLYTPILVIG